MHSRRGYGGFAATVFTANPALSFLLNSCLSWITISKSWIAACICAEDLGLTATALTASRALFFFNSSFSIFAFLGSPSHMLSTCWIAACICADDMDHAATASLPSEPSALSPLLSDLQVTTLSSPAACICAEDMDLAATAITASRALDDVGSVAQTVARADARAEDTARMARQLLGVLREVSRPGL